MVLILDGKAEHVAHVGREICIFGVTGPICDQALDFLIKGIKKIKWHTLLLTCASTSEWQSNISAMAGPNKSLFGAQCGSHVRI